MDYKNKYLKYKEKYIELKNQTGGFNINYMFGAIILSVIIIIFKRLNQCPTQEKGYRDPKTGVLRWRGKEDIINDIKEWFNTPKIKNNEEFKKLLEKEKITIGDIKAVLKKIKHKDISHIIKSLFKNYGDSTTKTQKNIDNIISNIDCVCASSKIYTNYDIVNPKCLEELKIDDYNNTLSDINLKTNCNQMKIHKNINSYDNVTYNIEFPTGAKCLEPELQNEQFIKSETEYNNIKKENNILGKIIHKFI